MKISPLKISLCTIFYFLHINQSWSGNGYYLGADYLQNSIKKKTTTKALGNLSTKESSEKSDDYGLRLGYRHKINQYIYIAPEFSYQTINKSSYSYSTNMKAGFLIDDLSVFGSLGYSEIDEFNNSSSNFGGGLEYKINDNFSIGVEYTKYQDVKTSDKESNVVIDKSNELQTLKFGVTYYFHE